MPREKNKSTPFYLLVFIALLVLAVLAGTALIHQPASEADAGQGQITDRSKICMLQDTIQPRSGVTYVFNGKKYYLCCAGCLEAFRQAPKAHSHAVDPVSGESVDKADALVYGYKGRAFFFSSAASMTRFASDPAKFLGNASQRSVQR